MLGRYQDGEQAIREAVEALQDLLPSSAAPEPQPVAKVAKLLTRLLTWQATFKSKMGMFEVANQLLGEG